LYVPYEFKEQAKSQGAKFDGKAKDWYIYESNPNKQMMVDLYHCNNFRHDCYGSHLKKELTTDRSKSWKT
jgi:hypothetical protein